ncbi:MAG: bacteriorhodopsin [Anaerolineae bacterium]|jgi:sensory rhodopsin|nr:bacteriorhodopsin [Anaerolineae bacterium]
MTNILFIIGFIVFSISSAYFYFSRRKESGLNTAFLVSFVTIASYALMWQGNFVAESAAGQPIFWTRWLFYAISCSLLMLEIAKVKGITGAGKVAQLIFLNVIVMGTGTLAAVSTGLGRWIFFLLSSIAYIIQISSVLKINQAKWVNTYIYLGWTGFPVVFLLAPTGFGLIGSAIAMGLYLVLDIYTKIAFNVQLKNKQ